MNMKRYSALSFRALFPALLLTLHLSFSAFAADEMEALLPAESCGRGWKTEGKPLFYDRETLSDRINGEAELFFPYGFDRMAASRYASEKSPETGIDVEIYRMGSPLDAFGIYANYRQKEGRTLAIGGESNLSDSQLFLYQGVHFVHLQITGGSSTDTASLPECARRVASLLPGTAGRPLELAVFDRPEIVRGSERYLPQSLLGYDFLNRGIMAEFRVEGGELQLFLLPGTTRESAVSAFDRFRNQLTGVKVEAEGKEKMLLEGVDPLYGRLLLLRKGACFAGALKFSSTKGVRALLESICSR